MSVGKNLASCRGETYSSDSSAGGVSGVDYVNAADCVNSAENLKKHGGNVRQLAESLGVSGIEIIDFSSNINPYGPPGSVLEAVKRAVDSISEYPEQEAESLAAEIAAYFDIDGSSVVIGNGSIELIYLIPQVLKSERGSGRALLVVPSFTEYEVALIKAGCEITYKTAFSAGKALEEISESAKDADIVILGNPNNPCGYSFRKAKLLEAVDSNTNTLWVIDEAFIDFTVDGVDETLVKEAITRDNLIVLRSMTKIYSIPGLRLGYMVTSPEVAKKVRDAKYPWSVNSVAVSAGIAAIKDELFIDHSVVALSSEAVRFFDELFAIEGLLPFIPSANYILVRIENGMTASQLQEVLLRKGFAIRDCSSYTGLDERYFRVAVKRLEDNNRLLEAMKEIIRAFEKSE